MRQTIYMQALVRAANLQGSTQALAGLLHVPENTLLRWMSGRAQMPLQAFLRLVDLIAQHESDAAGDTQAEGAREIGFDLGGSPGRCPRCDGERFRPAVPAAALGMRSTVLCSSCMASFVHGELLKAFASVAMKQSRALDAMKRLRPKAAAASLSSKTA